MSERRVVSVSRLVSYIRQSLESDPVLTGFLVEGEISNLRQPYSGHWYFSLKDANASMNCVMFASANRKVSFPVQNGTKVIVRGNCSVYPQQGALQIVVTAMKLSGIGDLYQQLELLKQKLSKEGLFDEAHKKRLPLYPMDAALVTGNNTAAREDVLITFRKRWPVAGITEYPAPVQGLDAPPKIIEALKKADEGGHQVILLVRGGGSIEDLWCFNDEALARCIYDLKTPVVTGIGHEIDFTIADFAADVRANTPTGAVETAFPDIHDVRQDLMNRFVRMRQSTLNRLSHERQRLNRDTQRPVFARPEQLYSDQALKLDYLRDKLMRKENLTLAKRKQLTDAASSLRACIRESVKVQEKKISDIQIRLAVDVKKDLADYTKQIQRHEVQMQNRTVYAMNAQRNLLSKNTALLDAYSPLKVLSRGYSIAAKENETIRSIHQVASGDAITVRVSDGTIYAEVNAAEEQDGTGKERNDI